MVPEARRMYQIAKEPWGFRLTFAGFIPADEMKRWLEESKAILAPIPKFEGLLVDMGQLKPLPEESQEVIKAGQKYYKERGVVRIAVVLANPVVRMQFKRLGAETGVLERERYLDVTMPDWEPKALGWVRDRVDPGN